MSVTTGHGRVKEAVIHILSGGTAGFVEVSLMHPLDLMKTRFQVQSHQSAHHYASLIDCVKKIYASEGFLSFYKGILPPILAETPKRATKFFTFEEYKRLFLSSSYIDLPTPVAFSLAGLCCGFTEALVINPFEVVKIRLQSQTNVVLSQQHSAFKTAKIIVRENGFGLTGLSKGLTATLMRHGVWNMVYFGFYHSVRPYLPKSEHEGLNVFRNFLLGTTAGFLSSVVNIPFDVAKSRIQGPQPGPPGAKPKYTQCFASMRTVYLEEGFLALYKGLLPKLLRLAPGGGIMFIVFERVNETLTRWL